MKAQLVVYREGKLLSTHPLPEPGTTIGRDEENHIRLDHPLVSRCHCAIHAKDGMWVIKDLSSTNGIEVNEASVTNAVLKSGDSIGIGPFYLLFQTYSGEDDLGPDQSPTTRYKPPVPSAPRPAPPPQTMPIRILPPESGRSEGGGSGAA